ncbi:hypothetical protein ABZX95_06240 [Streptomyces sp. NPDC004232]|uniref:hypothetical protein n=1 Tax=Streptomyces sp. NPDC004232 TaxID=3154454 RepID=UPI0033A4268F
MTDLSAPPVGCCASAPVLPSDPAAALAAYERHRVAGLPEARRRVLAGSTGLPVTTPDEEVTAWQVLRDALDAGSEAARTTLTTLTTLPQAWQHRHPTLVREAVTA